MADKTGIEWTDATWNPIRGCSRVSEGCRNCYAEKVAARFSGKDQPYHGLIAKGGQWNGSTLPPLPCGGVPTLDPESSCYAYRCDKCFAVVGSIGMPQDCYDLMREQRGVSE